MRWTRGYRSSQVEDRRGERMVGGPGLGGASVLAWLFSRFGLPGLLIGGAVLYFLSNQQSAPDDTTADPSQQQGAAHNAADDEAVQFVSFVLDDVQNTWAKLFAARGQTYTPARLVLFSGRTRSGCGVGDAQTGPFYCPSDQRVYIDLSFYRELKQRFGAPGDFAQAYVIAHEIGHHVQHLLGLSERAQSAIPGSSSGAGGASVRLELQADCLAGVWAHSTDQRKLLEPGDMDEALTAAAAIGDDRLQRSATGSVSPETWTHGSSTQRTRWLRRGAAEGSSDACDTFAAREL
jgi:predicted metalloprotease